MKNLERILIPGTSDRIDYDKPEIIRSFFRDYDQTLIKSLDDARTFIDFLSRYRLHIEKYTSLNGANFLSTIRNIFSVGNNGLYSDSMRFLYELIQNADDCDYDANVKPELKIRFDTEKKKLTFEYNEHGFTPRNVFAITGIAEDEKNGNPDKLQIGEKGIGFKSVFGVANSVLIRSGLFSFRLNRDHFTLPIPEYDDGFNGIKGTELTLEFDSNEQVDNVKKTVLDRYRKDDALFTQNPIVFLNKLNGLEFWSGEEQLLSFSINRPVAKRIDGKKLAVCHGMTLSLHRKGRPDRPISGTCYTTTIGYTREDCQSRYGMDTKLESREMKMEAFFPDASFVISENGKGPIEHGLMYSFLPTQVELEVPVICHVPFKLDASREYVDSQFRNSWFRRTMNALSTFIHNCYRLQAADVHESIVAYVPKYSKNFFAWKHNAKMEELLSPEYRLGGDEIGQDNIFYCKDGEFCAASEVVSFVKCEEIEQPLELLRLCGNTKPFFNSPAGFFPGGYNMRYIEAPYDELFLAVFGDKEVSLTDARKAVEIIKKKKPGLIRDACKDAKFNALNANHLIALAEVGELRTLIDTLIQRIRKGTRNDFEFYRTSGYIKDVFELIDKGASVGYEDMGIRSASYFKSVNGKILVLVGPTGGRFCLPACNVCVVAGSDPAACLIDMCGRLDPDSLFSVRLKLKKASASLDEAMTTDNPHEFLTRLRHIRLASKDTMGERAYRTYLDLIQKAGAITGRYINEIIQNADDCEYAPNVIPAAEIVVNAGELIVSTNEVGFKAINVRAITAIGESTKNLLLGADAQELTIGEKGVGFKSIFAIADAVEIHSGGFDFILKSDAPTIPCMACEEANHTGTLMRFKLKSAFSTYSITEKDVLDLCVCLRNLRKIRLYGFDVQIDDDGQYTRRVTINGDAHEFLVCEHKFEIRDQRAIEARNAGGKRWSPSQRIRCYVPTAIRRLDYPLYCGLPIRVKTCSPIIIDAPFELTTARDAVLEGSKWNECVLDNIYTGIVKTAELIKNQLRINVLHLFGVERVETKPGSLSYKVKMFNGIGEAFLNNTMNFIDMVRSAEIIPVKGRSDLFLRPEDCRLRVFPEVLSRMYDSATEIKCPFARVDFTGGQNVEHLRDVLEVLNVRGLDEREFWNVVENLGDLPDLMLNKDFRVGVYAFLRKMKYAALAHDHPIVPVTTEKGTRFVCESEGRFFYSELRRISTDKYYIVDTGMMDRKVFQDIFDGELKEMNAAQEREFYCDRICKYLIEHESDEIYSFILNELKSCNSENLRLCMPTIRHRCKGMIPLKNRNGVIACQKMFADVRGGTFFHGSMLKSIVVDPECTALATLLERPLFSAINYRDLPNDPWELSRNDILDIGNGNIEDKEDILLLAVKNGRVSEELAIEFGLTTGLMSDVADEFEFPTEPLKNFLGLKEHVRELFKNLVRIESRQVLRAVDFCVPPNGKAFELSSKESRQSALRRYSPYGRTDVCFCQMCQKVKRVGFIEVNCIERKPRFYFPELRLTLCLECSKKFELFRSNKEFCNAFIDKLLCLSAQNDDDNVLLRMPIRGNEVFSLLFTRTHMAEIQEILKGKLSLG